MVWAEKAGPVRLEFLKMADALPHWLRLIKRILDPRGFTVEGPDSTHIEIRFGG
jgi:hypothetical protein